MSCAFRWTFVLVVVLGAAVHAGAQASPPAPGAPPAAMMQGYAAAVIGTHARRVGGEAPRELRKTCEGDIDGDGRADAVVIYTIEGAAGAKEGAAAAGGGAAGAGGGGGKGGVQYAIVLTAAQQGFGVSAPTEVGRTGVRVLDGCTVGAGGVTATTKEYLPADPSCCPSKPGSVRLAFEQGKLVDSPAPAASPQ